MSRILLGSVVAVLVFVGCTEDKKTNEQTTVQEEVKSSAPVVEEKQAEVKTETKKEEEKKEEATPKQEEVTVVAPTGEVLFKVCASCHGEKAEKEALGKSQVIAGWDKDRIINAMNGYKDGSYGGIMKNIMKPQVETKTAEEIDILATYISNFK